MTGQQLYLAIVKELGRRISTGELKPGDQLPSETELCEEFNTSRGPVRQAVATLRSEGLVSSGRGRRSVVLGDSKTESFLSLLSNHRWLVEHGMEPVSTTLSLERRPASADVAEALRLEPGTPVIFLSRLRRVDGTPLLLENQYFPLSVGKHVMAMGAEVECVHEALIGEGVNFDSLRCSIEFIQAPENLAQLMEVPEGSPIIASTAIAFNSAGETLEYAEHLYLGNFLGYTINVVNGVRTSIQSDVLDEEDSRWAFNSVSS